jgi:2,4-dienoyl-CoA reductase-like NADH-dependent reductase (Old Yellow Enzyme family)
MLKLLAQPLTLPSGVTLPNRLAKAAMTEGLAASDDASPALARLYQRWSQGGAGLLIAGNAMVDRRFIERSGNVVLDEATDLAALQRWSEAGRRGGNQLWVQLNHPGRQCTRFHTSEPLAPSAVALEVKGFFAPPRELSAPEIASLVERFAVAARVARAGGFDGVQLHAAHGYLISQFLSPRSNRRSDRWGGELQGRARFLFEVLAAVRAELGPGVPVSVKLNAADFLRGGFEPHEAIEVARMLHAERVDLVELSGGTYERIAFVSDAPRAAATSAREAYFLRYARELADVLPELPLMLTGGFRSVAAMEEALSIGVDVVGLGRPLCLAPAMPRDLVGVGSGTDGLLPDPERTLKLAAGVFGPNSPSATIRAVNAQAATAWFYWAIERLAAEDEPQAPPRAGPLGAWLAFLRYLPREIWRAAARRRASEVG